MAGENSHFSKFQDLSYLDNLALFYLCNETPPSTLALAFLHGDPKVVGSMLGVLDGKRREYVHSLMAQQKNVEVEKKESAVSGLLIIAENLISRNLIEKRGNFYYGTERSK
ncbi:MAG TPA: FliG C-terminal domain-containing protein [Leptospiraceae bacterium]|nr:FliG C-terminal domain-containing protein [Leptospiraceae bacterium]HMW07660.1 FliG C-terminal domain-containing protein [Leptospiraceae bacterium]HMX35485.1 FliG C-terminal domain-containing protein [Leptospiraceae bacterium]HMY33326.1 FliG C-terminal domain-containing protein [Leptospiraceae bacterium]HNA08530.1 FliG C-terminal domain-containing protein [Leptospiraceae bacterium]